jgi:ribonucleoside-diphosphate reductase alpha chain
MAQANIVEHKGNGMDSDGAPEGEVRLDAEQPTDASRRRRGMRFERQVTEAGVDPLDTVRTEKRTSVITGSDGSVVFRLEGAEIPAEWSQLATDIIVSKYFRKAGLFGDKNQGERSARQVVHRIAHTIRDAGDRFGGYFATPEDADAFEAELSWFLIHQYGAFNSPVWFNCGLFHEYDVKGAGGNWAWNPAAQAGSESEMFQVDNNYERPQCSACFIQSVEDDLMSMFDLVKNEARLFKYGSGTGTNFSSIRGKHEKLSGGGTSSGLMSFLEVFDRAAGSTKSGGTTRRAAKMVCLDMDHPEIADFIGWKVREEKKARALIAAGYPADFNGEAYHTVSGQNSNNSVRVTDEFMRAATLSRGGGQPMAPSSGSTPSDVWHTRERTSGAIAGTYKASELWSTVAEAAWECADPGVQYDSTINRWHTCPNTDPIRASNPCVTGDTLVATAAGWQRIDALLEQPFEVVGADGALHAISPAFQTGVKPVYRLRTRAGFELRLTGDHRVLTDNRGDVQACELSKDDRIMLARPGFGTARLDERLGEFLGLMLGDGCITGEQEHAIVTLAPEEEALARGVHERLGAFKREHAADGRAARDTEVTHPQGTIRLGTSARCVVDELARLATLDRGSENKRLLPAGLGLDRASTAAVLRGLFTADGTVANYGEKSQYVALDSTSLELLQQVQLLLLGFGIKAKLYRDRRPAGQTMALLPDGKGGRKEYPVQQIHSLRISRSSRVLFEKAIGFLPESPKVAALSKLNAEVAAYEDRWVDTIVSLELVGEEPVYDLTEPDTHHFAAAGIVVHNCSEYMFLDDSACNLSSLNLTKFLREDNTIDVELYRHAVRVFFTAQEILVDLSSYPTRTIAKNSHDYRPLGLGYANLGTLLMRLGLPYDSDEGRAVAASLTAILCGHAYKTSADVAASKGAFAGYAKNEEPMLRVMGMHREAAYAIDRDLCPEYLWRAAVEDWDGAVELGKQHGYRNAQATVLAPTGTIGLLMDCDTTGVEPDFALVKFKKLAGGGYFKIVNQSVPAALRTLGYSEAEIQEIVAYISGTNTLLAAPHVSRAKLLSLGLTKEELDKVEQALPSMFELSSAFAPWVVGEDAYARLGVPGYGPRGDTPHPGGDKKDQRKVGLLRHLGFSDAQIQEASDVIVGHMTIEGAPHIAAEHLPVFDCANRCGRIGQRFLAPMSHVKMMAATQPFLSGAISKTVNLPNEATVEDVKMIYEEGWRLGLKAVALYRDGCKASQPLSSKDDSKDDKKEAKAEAPAAAAAPAGAAPAGVVAAAAEVKPLHPVSIRVRLPRKRTGFTQEARVGGHKIFLRTGEYLDGTLGEIFIDMHKEGAAFRSLMNCFAMAVSVGLQYGVPLETYVDQFTFTRFEPGGTVEGHDNIKFATSIVDYLFRVLGVEYLHRYDLAHVPPQEEPAPTIIQDPTESRAEEQALQVAEVAPAAATVVAHAEEPGTGGLDAHLEEMMGDAPVCDVCGHITVRNGACYKCLNCGNSLGCS